MENQDFDNSELKLLVQKLEKEHAEKSGLIETVSHELKTPLSIIKMALAVLATNMGTPAKRDKMIKMCQRAVDRLLRLTDDYLNLSRIESGRLTCHQAPNQVYESVKHVLRGFMRQAKDQEIALINHIPGDLPYVMVDLDRFVQIMTNLIHNALKFTPKGGRVAIESRVDEKFVCISIRDTGCGISKKDQLSIFERYKQVSQKGKRTPQEGTGLGLSIVKALVEAQGGQVFVESALKKGTCFSFTLPLARGNG